MLSYMETFLVARIIGNGLGYVSVAWFCKLR